MDYENFLERKRHSNKGFGFDPLWLSDTLYDFQKHLVELKTSYYNQAIKNLDSCIMEQDTFSLV